MSSQDIILPTSEAIARHEDAWLNLARVRVPMKIVCQLLLDKVIDTGNDEPHVDETDLWEMICDSLAERLNFDLGLLPLEQTASLKVAIFDLYRALYKLRSTILSVEQNDQVIASIQQSNWCGIDMVISVQTESLGHRHVTRPQ